MCDPRLAHTSKTGGTTNAGTSSQTERAFRIARAVIINSGVEMSHSKVSRLVRTFERRVAGNGWSFFDYLANSVALTAEKRRELLNNPDIRKEINYADPTGERAAANVDRAMGWR